MNDFTASNGVTIAKYTNNGDGRDDLVEIVARDGSRMADWDYLDRHDMQALREFLQAEADERLGRWRWTENPDYVVYPSALYLTPSNNDLAQVVNEANGQCHRVRRDDPDSLFGLFSEAGAAYFDAHPEPKPWHDAKPREVWVLTHVKDETSAFIVDGNRFESGSWSLPLDASSITAGRRIWPEVSA
ncbi:hypothetical protein [uncultured Microbacterium sp.]|uniref:hypothetical protein n=1 Tax=uncultured Microbacterium sp. TaxID=191216 RepID=UPI0025FD489D|nr:hypothetical protein [uncultured Microbacterium sp.]